tara:strand:+ start:57 stop:383 length:327 start_codon:yes stop_codon:yes gene_type:complete
MAESLDEYLEQLNKLLKPLETEKSKELAEDLKKSLDAMKKIGKKRKGGSVSRKRGGGYVTPKKNIIDDNASKRSRLRSEERRKRAIRAAASKKGGGKIMQGYKAGGKV